MKHVFFIFALAIASCSPSNEEVRQRLLAQFPRGTARADIEQRLAADQFTLKLDETRPSEGWSGHQREQIQRIESSAQRPVTRVQRYQGTHGAFSLAFLSFYFDESDYLIDLDARLTD